MPTHFMQTDNDGVCPYAYCPVCGWAEVFTTQEKADSADAEHKHNTEGDTRYDDDGANAEPKSEPA